MFSKVIQLFIALMILALPAWAEHGNSLSSSSSKSSVVQSTGDKVRSEMESSGKSLQDSVKKSGTDFQSLFQGQTTQESSILPELGLSGRGAAGDAGGSNTTSNDIAESYKTLADISIAGTRAETELLLQRVDDALAAAAQAPGPRPNAEKLGEVGRYSATADPLGNVMTAIDEKNSGGTKPPLNSGTASAGSSQDHAGQGFVINSSGTRSRGVSSVTQGMEKAYNPPDSFR